MKTQNTNNKNYEKLNEMAARYDLALPATYLGMPAIIVKETIQTTYDGRTRIQASIRYQNDNGSINSVTTLCKDDYKLAPGITGTNLTA